MNKLIWTKCNDFHIQLLASSVEAELSRPQLKPVFILFLCKFSVCKNNAYIFRLVHMKVSSTISIKNDKTYLTLLEILQFGNQFLGIHSILKNAVSTQIKPGRTFTVTSARKDLLKAVSMGLILQGISVPFLWSWMFSIQFIEGWVFYVLSCTSSCKQVCPHLKTW